MAWVILFIAGLFEVGWAVCLKFARGFTNVWPTIGFAFFGLASMYLLSLALRTLPLGTAYAVWTGIGAVGTAVFGMLLLGEGAEFRRLACISLIVIGIVGLKLVSPE